MKYLTILCDGMADEPCSKLGGRTPMEAAEKPVMNSLAGLAASIAADIYNNEGSAQVKRYGTQLGTARTTPPGMKPGSDVANMSVMGYSPADYYTGRSPLEAASMGIELEPDDVAFRCNFVTLSEDDRGGYSGKTMLDYCAGDISTEEAVVLIEVIRKLYADVAEDFENKYHGNLPRVEFYPGVCYRHCMVWRDGADLLRHSVFGNLTPPHDIADKPIAGAYAKQNGVPEFAVITELMRRSFDVLSKHPVNLKRAAEGKRPANSIWIWGEGTAAQLPDFKACTGLSGVIISAVDLLRGIGKVANMRTPEVEGVTGYLDTNFAGKAAEAVNSFKNGDDYVYVHIEAPDECGHRGQLVNKVRSIEIIDSEILKPILEYLDGSGENYRVLICPDHYTPVAIKTHTAVPVPFLLYDSRDAAAQGTSDKDGMFSEATAQAARNYLEQGYKLRELLTGTC